MLGCLLAISSMFVSSNVGSDFATGLITLPSIRANCLYGALFWINSDENRQNGLICQGREENE
jgi:hypothetical protein